MANRMEGPNAIFGDPGTRPEDMQATEVPQSAVEMNSEVTETGMEKSQETVEGGQEAPEKLRGEARGREVLAKAGERVVGFGNSLATGVGRLLNKMKGWTGKAMAFAGKVAAKAGSGAMNMVAKGIGNALDSTEFLGDKISEDYKLTMERHDARAEALAALGKAAENKLASSIELAGRKFHERTAKFKVALEKRAKMIEGIKAYHDALLEAVS